MKILHLISSSGLLGAEIVLLELAAHSRKAGLNVSIGVFENSQNPNSVVASEARANNFEVKVFPCNGRLDKNTIQMIKDYVNKADIRILHSHNYKSNFYTRMALSDKAVRWVVTNHGRRVGLKLFAYNLLDMLIVRQADRLIAVSEEIAGRMKLAGIAVDKIHLIENGIGLERFNGDGSVVRTKESLGIKKDSIVIGTVGSLTKEKGHAYLLDAVPNVIKKFPGAVFLIVGDGRERESLERMSGKIGAKDKVFFAGMRKDIPEILSMLDVFVLPSLNEGLPMALLEAQAARVPTLATRVGAIPKVVQDGVTGILISPRDSIAISNAICNILSDKRTALEMAEKGFERVRGNFSSQKMASKYFAIYKELMEGAGCSA